MGFLPRMSETPNSIQLQCACVRDNLFPREQAFGKELEDNHREKSNVRTEQDKGPAQGDTCWRKFWVTDF